MALLRNSGQRLVQVYTPPPPPRVDPPPRFAPNTTPVYVPKPRVYPPNPPTSYAFQWAFGGGNLTHSEHRWIGGVYKSAVFSGPAGSGGSQLTPWV